MTFTVSGLSGYPTVVLQPGNTVYSANVYALQEWLVKNGFLTQAEVNTGPGIYGPQTTAAVEALQEALVGTGYLTQAEVNSGPGYYGPLTIAAVGAELAALTTTPAAPTATAHNQSGVAPGTSIPLSTLFTYSVASGDTVLGFDFKETTNDGGYVTDNNGNRLTPGIVYGNAGTGIPISELSQYHYVAGPAGTSDTVAFNVEDQYDQISAAVSATVSVALPAAPTATAHNQSGVAPGTSIPLSTLFTYSAAAGDTVLGFDFKETTNDGGYITDNNGNRLTPGIVYGNAGTGIPISELSQYHFVAGPAGTSDSVSFNVEDQFNQINTAVSATVTTMVASPANMVDALYAPTVASEIASLPRQYQSIAFYLGRPIGSPFNRGDAEEITQSNRSIVSIFESGQIFNDPSYFTAAQADADAAAAVRTALAISQPLGSAIYFAVDDADSALTPANISAIDSYFREISADFTNLEWLIANVGPIATTSPYKIGVYAGGSVLSAVQRQALPDLDYYWVDPNYLGGSFSGAQITRDVNTVSIAGISVAVDTDTTSTSNFGQWSWVAPADALSESAPVSLMAVAGAGAVVSGVSVIDAGAGSDTLTTKLTAKGVLTATGTGVSGSGTTSLTITGSLSQVNTDLATLSYKNASAGSDTITVTTSDSHASPTSVTKAIGVTINPADALSENVPAPLTATAGVSKAISGVLVVDAGAGNDSFTTKITAKGTLTATGTGVSGSGTTSLTVTGSLSQVNADLATLSYKNASTGSDTVTVTTTDAHANPTSVTKTIAVTINPADALSESAPTSLTATAGASIAVSGVSIVDAGAGSDTFTTKITAKGTLTATGTSVSGSGTSSLTVTGSLSQVNTDLATLSYKNASAGSDTITVTTSDSHASPTSVGKTIGVTINSATTASVTLNDATMSNDGALQIVDTFNGNGGTVTYYGPVLFDGFTITNLDRTDFALNSFNAGFASTNGYFFDGADVLDVPAGGSVPAVDTIQIQQQNGDPFSVQSIDLDTIFAATGQSATFKGVTANNSIVTETFDLDNVQGMQTFKFASTFTDLKYLDFAPSMNEFFDNIVLTPTSTPGELSQDAAYSSTTIEAGETLEIKNAYSGGVDFTASTGTLQLDSSSSFSGTVAGMSGQDTIDFRDIKFANQKPAYTGTAAGGTLSLTDGTHSANIALLGNYLASTFVASSDGHGGTNVVDPLLVASNQQTLLTQPQHA